MKAAGYEERRGDGVPAGWSLIRQLRVHGEDRNEALERIKRKFPRLEIRLADPPQSGGRWCFLARRRRFE